MSREVAEVLAESMGTRVFDAFVREAVEVEDAHNEARTIGERNPKARPSLDYSAFVDELLEGLGE